MNAMRLVINFTGSTMLAHGERPDAATEQWHIRSAVQAVMPLVRDHDVVLCYSNAPVISTLALESENDDTLTRPFPLDALSAQTQGLIGYWLMTELRRAGIERPVTAMITQALAAPAGAGTAHPRVFLGPPYTREQIQLWAGELGWEFGNDNGAWRRTVASLEPSHIVELPTIEALLAAGTCVVCGAASGSGTRPGTDNPQPVDGLVDSDLSAARLAIDLAADRLLMLVGKRDLISSTNAHPASVTLERSTLAARRFANATGRASVIGTIAQAVAMANGEPAGHIVIEPTPAAVNPAPGRAHVG